MAFILDKEELKPGLIIFRRGDVDHRNWYCRIKVPKTDRYKTYALKTTDIGSAKERAFDHDADVRFRVKHDVPVFDRAFRDVAQEFIGVQQARASRGEITAARAKVVKAIIEGTLDDYVGSIQAPLIGDELWAGYPAWRRENGAGLHKRNGVREVSGALAARLEEQDAENNAKALRNRGILIGKSLKKQAAESFEGKQIAFISDATIRFEMAIFGAVMNYAIKKGYVPASRKFERPKLKTMRRDEFTVEEYRKLHSLARAWIKEAASTSSAWYRAVTYNFVLIMCNTGMRPSEAKNLRWRDMHPAKDREGRDIVVLFVQGKGKSRKLVAPQSVADYLERIRVVSKATRPDDRVFTTITGTPAKSLYSGLIEDLLTYANLREGAHGAQRTTYCFRHTYATFRLQEGVDVYFLAEQMGTSVKMIEDHYGHVNTIKHADRVLQGMAGWEPVATDLGESKAKSSKAAATRNKSKGRRNKRDDH